MVAQAFSQHSGGRSTRILVSSRPTWLGFFFAVLLLKWGGCWDNVSVNNMPVVQVWRFKFRSQHHVKTRYSGSIWNSSSEMGRDTQISGAHWPDNLAKFMNPCSMKDPTSKSKIEENRGSYSVLTCGLYTHACTYMCTPTCTYAHTHICTYI